MKFTQKSVVTFCNTLSGSCNVGEACKAAGITRRTAYNWRDKHPEFARAWDEALRIGVSALEDEVHRRAFVGTEEPVFHRGRECGIIRKYSDTLAIFLLKAHVPEKYRDNSRVELTGARGGPLQISDTERAARIAAILTAARSRIIDVDVGAEPVTGATTLLTGSTDNTVARIGDAGSSLNDTGCDVSDLV